MYRGKGHKLLVEPRFAKWKIQKASPVTGDIKRLKPQEVVAILNRQYNDTDGCWPKGLIHNKTGLKGIPIKLSMCHWGGGQADGVAGRPRIWQMSKCQPIETVPLLFYRL